jgi:cytochrome c biogenesis protein CcmG/thiol:disulfide interchange protein DsbE
MNELVRDLSPDRTAAEVRVARWRRRLLFMLPALAFGGVGAALVAGLGRDPRVVPSALIGRPVPRFALPPVQGRTLGLSSADLVGEVALVNVFASWCTACLEEHPIFMRLTRERVVPVHGLNFKDAPADAAAWLDKHGDPYTRTGADRDGRVGIEWGVYGVPETYVVGRDGRIYHRQVGPLSEGIVAKTVMPLIAGLRR